jgi:HlyD family type I secretion membrane fusion protein
MINSQGAQQGAQSRTESDRQPTASQTLERGLARSSRRLMLTGSLSLVVGVGALGAWATLAPLTTAALANGYVKVAGERKTIQHLEGGIVREILVREGQTVSKGQVLLRLVDVTAKARLALLMVERDALLAEMGRLEAERDGRPTPIFSDVLMARRQDDGVARLIAGELNLFNSRRASFVGQIEVLEQRKRQAREKIEGRLSEIASTRTQLEFILEELRGAESLLEQGMYLRTRYYALKRTEANLEGMIARLSADVAEAQAQVGETDLRILDLRNQLSREVNDRLQDIRAKLRDLAERVDAAADVLARTEIVAPDAGTVIGLQAHTAGGVVAAGAPILQIVPNDDRLVVEAQVQLQDINRIWPGMPAEVRFSAFNSRATPVFAARVSRVSPDRFVDPARQRAYFVAQVEIDRSLAGAIELQPGMPAEVYFVEGKRTPLDYLVKPVREQLRRAMTER